MAKSSVEHFSLNLTGGDNGSTLDGKPAKELMRMLQQLALTQSELRKAQAGDFPQEWPASLQLPQNCYIGTKQVLVPNSATSTWQGCFVINAQLDKVSKFLKSQFEQFGVVDAEMQAQGGKSVNLVVQATSGDFAALSAILAKSSAGEDWTRVFFEFVPRTQPGAPGGKTIGS